MRNSYWYLAVNSYNVYKEERGWKKKRNMQKAENSQRKGPKLSFAS